MCVYVLHVFLVPWRAESIGTPGTGITNDCETPRGCWELNLGLSARAESAFNISVISPASGAFFLFTD